MIGAVEGNAKILAIHFGHLAKTQALFGPVVGIGQDVTDHIVLAAHYAEQSLLDGPLQWQAAQFLAHCPMKDLDLVSRAIGLGLLHDPTDGVRQLRMFSPALPPLLAPGAKIETLVLRHTAQELRSARGPEPLHARINGCVSLAQSGLRIAGQLGNFPNERIHGIVEAAHSAHEPGVAAILEKLIDRMAHARRFDNQLVSNCMQAICNGRWIERNGLMFSVGVVVHWNLR